MNGLRLLITEECQYNCFYCHRKEGICSLEELTEERLLALCSALAGTGFSRAEITGGEPLLYPGTADLVRALKEQCGFSEVYLTTNGVLLSQYAKALKDAGTDGVNIHVDTMAAEDFSKSTGREQMLNDVLNGIWGAVAADLSVTVTAAIHQYSLGNCAVMAGLAKQMPVTVRFASIGAENDAAMKEMIMQKIQILCGGDRKIENGIIRPDGWKGCITFGNGITGAFGMEKAVLLGGNVYAV